MRHVLKDSDQAAMAGSVAVDAPTISIDTSQAGPETARHPSIRAEAAT